MFIFKVVITLFVPQGYGRVLASLNLRWFISLYFHSKKYFKCFWICFQDKISQLFSKNSSGSMLCIPYKSYTLFYWTVWFPLEMNLFYWFLMQN